VVHDVGGPQQGDLVARAVQPVVQEVVGEQRADPDRRRMRAEREHRRVGVHPLVDAQHEQLGEDADHLAHHAQPDAVEGVGPRIGDAAALPAHEQLDGDEPEEYGGGEHDDLGVLHRTMRVRGRRTAAVGFPGCVAPADGAGCKPGRVALKT
jgi:hypothetical protein